MKNYIYTLLVIIFACSCAKDDSTLLYPEDNPNFSKISIGSVTDSLSVDFGQILEFTPEVSQTIESKELEYEWSACLKVDGVKQDSIVIGKEKTLRHAFLKMGSYDLRLEVKNDDYSEFYTWNLDVRVYDEGFMVVGMNDQGESNIAFARKLSSMDIIDGKQLEFTTDLIGQVNPDFRLKDIVFVGKSILSYGSDKAYLFIFCKEVVYVADPNTFEIIALLRIDESVPGAKIKKVSMLDTYASGARLFTEDGRNLAFEKAEFLIYESKYYSGTYDEMYGNLFYTVGSNMNVDQINVDYEESKIWTTISYHANNEPVNNTTSSESPYDDNVRENEYEGRNIISVGRMNGDYWEGTNFNFFAVATDKENANDVKIVEFSTSYSTGISTVSTTEYISEDAITLKPETEIIANARYSSMYYYNGGDIYLWYPTNLPPNNHLPTSPSIELGGDKEITCMAISYDMKELYVGFYDASASGELKGGLYIYKCEEIGVVPNLQPIKKFEGITSRPVQVLYKTKDWGKYTSVN